MTTSDLEEFEAEYQRLQTLPELPARFRVMNADGTPCPEREAPHTARFKRLEEIVRQAPEALGLDIRWINGRPELIGRTAGELKVKSGASGMLLDFEEVEARKRLSRTIGEILATRTEVEWLPGLDDVLERGVIAVMPGAHGTYKSTIAWHWTAIVLRSGVPVFYCNGEGSDEDRRIRGPLQEFAPGIDAESLPLNVMSRRLNLNGEKERTKLCEELRAVGFSRGLLIIDTYTKFASIDQNDNSAVSTFLNGLAAIRSEFQCTILLLTHVGHGDKTRARGASSLIDDTDAEYVVSADPLTKVVRVSRDRFKSSPSLPPLYYAARVVDLGYVDSRGQPVTSLVLDNAEPVNVRPREALAGNLAAIVDAAKAMQIDGEDLNDTDVISRAVADMPKDGLSKSSNAQRRGNMARALQTAMRRSYLHRAPGTAEGLSLRRVIESDADSFE